MVHIKKSLKKKEILPSNPDIEVFSIHLCQGRVINRSNIVINKNCKNGPH